MEWCWYCWEMGFVGTCGEYWILVCRLEELEDVLINV